MTMKKLEQKLQRADRKQAVLYLVCNFISLMLITAYTLVMYSPTVTNTLPSGGDSLKQMYAVFVLALFGCLVFTVYASTLFFRKKSRQLGILMALGASRKRLSPGLFREVLFLSGASSILGILAGFPLVLLLWKGFRLILSSTKESVFIINFGCLYIPFLFLLIVCGCACALSYIYLRRTDILDVIQEEHKNEPVKALGKWCGPVGILLVFAGAAAGYCIPVFCIRKLHFYPSVWYNLLYSPVFIGLYMIMLHTVVHGWFSHRKHPYRGIISRSMMKFQGRQTVNSLLVSTVLIAGGCFAIFYIPMLGTSQIMEVQARPYDYMYAFPSDQEIPEREDIEHLGEKYNLTFKDWKECSYIDLSVDGNTQSEPDENGKFSLIYRERLHEERFISAESYTRMTGQKITLPRGKYRIVNNDSETGNFNTSSGLFTNMCTRKTLSAEFDGFLHYGQFLEQRGSYYVLNDTDYREIGEGITPDWKGNLILFNVNGKDNYDFADEFFHSFVSAFDPEYKVSYYYDRVGKAEAEARGEVYWGDTEKGSGLSLLHPDASDFRIFWKYMPKFRSLDSNDFLDTFGVYLMLFLFIATICFTAALVIGYTRCRSIALNNRYIFDDLRRLGASPQQISDEISRQCSIVFKIPSVIGMILMSLLYFLMLFANDSLLSSDEIAGLAVCFGVLIIIAAIIFGVYIHTVRHLERELNSPA